MAGRVPKVRKPPEQLRRRNAPETWTVLPAEGCALETPRWPTGEPSADESVLWQRLWAAPIACWWHDQAVEVSVVARYVRLALAKPEHATVGRLEGELGLTPAALLRMRLVVEQPEPDELPTADPYTHLRPVA